MIDRHKIKNQLYLVKFFHVFGTETNDKIQGPAGAFAPALQEIRK
jgi:hypothetical protein